MPTKWYDGKVIKIKAASPTTKRFWLQVEELEKIEFKAGQFITMDLPIHEKRLQRWKSYSIASVPNEGNILELCIVLLEGGLGTNYLFNEVELGSTIKFKGPLGVFTLPEKIETDLVFICTGTGVAPFRSMIGAVLEKIDHSIHLIFGTRKLENVLYQEEFQALAAQYSNFKYSVALSRAKELPEHTAIEFSKGYVHDIYKKAYSEVEKQRQFYLCGWSNMIDEAVANLEEMGYEKRQIHFELYG